MYCIDRSHWIVSVSDSQKCVQLDFKHVNIVMISLLQSSDLCVVLRDLIGTLDAHGETFWRNWMAKSLKDLEAKKLQGAKHLLGAYGGMGSFNDLYIPDAKLTSQRSRAHNLADKIMRGEDVLARGPAR